MPKIILIIIAIVLFVFAAFSFTPIQQVAMLPLGLACFAAAFLPWRE